MRLPTYINTSAKVTKALNLNVYRNLHHHSLNIQKRNFHDAVKPLLKHIPRAEKIWIHYKIFAPRNGCLDTMNVGSIVDKYFSDTLVETKKIMDDHFDHVVLVSFSFGGVCKLDGHAIATINILEEETPMRILLDDNDIQIALETYVATQGISGSSGVKITIDGDTIEAEVLMGDPTPPPATKPKNKGGRPAGSKNKKPAPEKEPEPPEEVTPDVVENDTKTGSDGTDSGPSEPATSPAETGPETVVTELKAPEPETKTPAAASGKKKGNLFGDEEDSPSSATTETKTEDSPPEEAAPPLKKKSSIFDVK